MLREGRVLAGIALIGVGLAVLHDGRVLTRVAIPHDGRVLTGIAIIGAGIAAIGCGIVILGRIGIGAHAMTWLASLTRDPNSEAPHDDDPPISRPEDPPGTPAPRSKPPQLT